MHNDDSGADEEFKAINLVLSVSEEHYEEFQKETKIDPELQAVLAMVKNGWPRPYWTFQGNMPNCPLGLKCSVRSTRGI